MGRYTRPIAEDEDSDNVRYSNIARARTSDESHLGKPTDLRVAPIGTAYRMI